MYLNKTWVYKLSEKIICINFCFFVFLCVFVLFFVSFCLLFLFCFGLVKIYLRRQWLFSNNNAFLFNCLSSHSVSENVVNWNLPREDSWYDIVTTQSDIKSESVYLPMFSVILPGPPVFVFRVVLRMPVHVAFQETMEIFRLCYVIVKTYK